MSDPSFSQDLYALDVLATATTALAFPALFVTQLATTGVNWGQGATVAATYLFWDQGFPIAYLAGGITFALTEKTALESAITYGASEAQRYGVSSMCKNHPTLAVLMGLKC